MTRALGVIATALVAASCASAAGRAARSSACARCSRGLDSPLYATAAPGEPNNLYIVEQPGRILVATNGKLRAKPFLDIRSLVRSGGEQGLLSVAFHPKYRTNHKFYVDYTDAVGDTRVMEYRSNGRYATGRIRQLLYVKQPYANHNGGQLQFGPDGKLYVGMGDGGSGGDPQNHAQNLSSRLGKLSTIDVDARSARSSRSPATGCATRGASRSTRAATSTSATSARTPGRRSTTRRARAPGSRTTAGTSTRARTRSRARRRTTRGSS